MLSTYLGTPGFASPQILLRQKYTTKSEIFSLGAILYILLHKKMPWEGESIFDIRINTITQPLQINNIKIS